MYQHIRKPIHVSIFTRFVDLGILGILVFERELVLDVYVGHVWKQFRTL